MSEIHDPLNELLGILAFVLLLVFALAYIVTDGAALSFERTVVLMLLNVGTVALE
jgi:hypothetical protein